MKKIIILVVFLSLLCSANAQNAVPQQREIPHSVLLDLEYQIKDFKETKFSGCYGFSVSQTSFANKGNLHLGANFHMDCNAGLVSDSGLLFELGPSGRCDISKDCFINAPLNVVCAVTSYTINSKTETQVDWGMRLAPSLYYFFSKPVGLFVGPQLFIPFYKNANASFGMQAGVSISF